MSNKFNTHLVRCDRCLHLYDINEAASVRMYGGFGEGIDELMSGLANKVFSLCPKCHQENFAGTESAIFGADSEKKCEFNN